METHLQPKYSNVPFEGNHPSCMGGVFHIFHFPHRFYTRKTLPDKKHLGDKQDGGVKIAGAAGEGQGADGKVGSLDIAKRKKMTTPRKKSGKSHIKTLIAEEMSKEQEQKQQVNAFPTQLMRTNSIHHLECNDYVTRTALCENTAFQVQSHEKSSYNSGFLSPLLPKYPEEQTVFNKHTEMCGTLNRSTNNLDPNKIDDVGNQFGTKQGALLQKKIDEANEAFLEKKLMDDRCHGRDVSLQPPKEFLDAIDVFNEHRELFVKILQHPNPILVKHVRSNSNPEAVLTKCGSFPETEFSVGRAASLIKLKKKQQEIQSFANQRKSQARTTASLRGDSYSESVPLKVKETAEAGTSLKSVPNLPHELKKQKESGKVMNCLKDIKQRIKHAIKEGKKERLRISMDGILHKIPYGRKASKNAKVDSFKDSRDIPKSHYNSNIVASTSAKGEPRHIKRSPSLAESLERYSQLLESISSKGTSRHLSEQLKLANEDGSAQDRHSSRTFQRIFSMPESGSYFLGRYMDSDVPHDMLHRRTPSRVLLDSNTDVDGYSLDYQKPEETLTNMEKSTHLDPSVETESPDKYVENISGSLDGDQDRLAADTDGCLSAEEIVIDENLTAGEDKGIPLHGQETWPIENTSDNLTQANPVSVLNSCILEDITSPIEVSMLQVGSEIKPASINFSEVDHCVNLQDHSIVDVPDSSENKENVDEVQTPSVHGDSDAINIREDGKDDAEFNYVRNVLKKSGFSGAELLGTWHSTNQPVDPLLFDEFGCSPHKLEVPEPVAVSSCDHQLLFDLINEVLLEIYERSFAYWPWRLCSNSSTRPMPVGYHVLEEVWAGISWHLGSQAPQLRPSLDCVVARDLSKNDGWMRLQGEAECVGLELEDWIIDDLLDEVTFEIAATCKH